MSGRILLSEKEYVPQKHDHIVFTTNNGYMVYNDPRRFGLCTYTPSDKLMEHPLFDKIGIDPFDPQFNGVTLKEKLIKKTIPIKLALLDQSIICGIGNIYASEALFLAKILPTRPSNSLSDKECKKLVEGIRQTLSMAIEAGGSTLRDYKRPDGNLGYFQNHHCVYNKTGQRCPNCQCDIQKTGGIKKIIMNNRSTFFCETKQR
jgi:formamidopyrimidine-DNA glycosylase